MDKFTKITIGFVSQTFELNDDGKMVCIEQEFIAGDEVSYEDEHGEPLVDIPEHQYQYFDMVQPEFPKQFMVEGVNSGAEMCNPFMAYSKEEALEALLEEEGFKVKEVK